MAGASFALMFGLIYANGKLKRTPTPQPPAPLQGVGGETGFGQPHIGAVTSPIPVLEDVRVLDFGREVYRGKMDLNPTIERIRKGEVLQHRNDGGFFRNRERLLPQKSDREFYREFVQPKFSPKFPGPQRVVIGKDGSVWYTGDHYESFVKVTK